MVFKLFYNNDEMKRSPLAYRRCSLFYLSLSPITVSVCCTTRPIPAQLSRFSPPPLPPKPATSSGRTAFVSPSSLYPSKYVSCLNPSLVLTVAFASLVPLSAGDLTPLGRLNFASRRANRRSVNRTWRVRTRRFVGSNWTWRRVDRRRLSEGTRTSSLLFVSHLRYTSLISLSSSRFVVCFFARKEGKEGPEAR